MLHTVLVSFERIRILTNVQRSLEYYILAKTRSGWSHDFIIVNWAIIGFEFILSFLEDVIFVIMERASEVVSLGKLDAVDA